MIRTSFRRLFRLERNVARRPRAWTQATLRLESLEHRLVPSTLHVGATEPFHTIQAAVTAAQSGDKILVDPGIYQEQVIITTSNLTLNGSGQAAVIEAPASFSTATKNIVDVHGAQNITIQQFTISGPGSGPADSLEYGIRIDGGGSAIITGNHITHIRDNPLSGDQNGVAILVGRAFEGQTGSAVISQNTIDDYQKGGIVVSNIGSSAMIDHNTITGVGPTALIAQNGIQVSSGANATISHNVVSGNIYTPQTFASTDILLFSPGAVSIDHNQLSASDVAIYALGANGAIIANNQITGSTFDGIDLDGTTNSRITHNDVSNSGADGIAFFDNATGNFVDHNSSTNNGHDGIFVDVGSTGNTFDHNQLKGNANLDAEDLTTGTGTAGTGNTWTHNKLSTDNKGGGLGN
jgi:parallel beta-helix repeat protein